MTDEPARSRQLVAALGAIAVHAVLAAIDVDAGREQPATPPVEVDLLEVDLAPPPEPPPPEPPPEPAPVAEPRPTAPAPAPAASPAPRNRPRRAAPAPAGGGTPGGEVLDFGEQQIGNAGGPRPTSGGAGSGSGSGSGSGVGSGSGSGVGAGPDRSRDPSLAHGVRWDCPFPDEADDAGVDLAIVTLRVAIAADGTVGAVRVVRDPGHGFAREAVRCAQQRRWRPGADRSGAPIAATGEVNVRFER